MRARFAVVLALVMVTAGCSAFAGGDGQDTPTLTPAPVPTEPPTPSDSRIGVAPGVSTDGVTHPDYLAERHAAAVRETSYVYTQRYVENRTLDDETATVNRWQRIVVENATVYRRDMPVYEGRKDGRPLYRFDYSVWANGRAEFRTWRSGAANERVFRRHPDPSARPRYAAIPVGAIQRYLDLETATVSHYDMGGVAGRYYQVVGSRSTLLTVGPVENYTARALIREDGFVRNLTVTYDTTDRNANVSVRLSFGYRDVGTATVTPPPWAEEARAQFEDESDTTDR